MSNLLAWADVPVTDMARARKFYAEVLRINLEGMPGMGDTVATPVGTGEGDISFDLAKGEGLEPSAHGPRIYFDSKGDIDGMVARGISAGGTLVSPPRDLGPVVGIIAFLLDSEGNTIGIRQHSAMTL